MTFGKWCILVGGGCLALGLASAFLASRYDVKAFTPEARMGLITLASEEGTSERMQRERMRRRADRLFWAGLVLTLLGVVLQTLGSLLP